MSRLYQSLALIACLGLMISLTTWWRARRELHAVTTANEFLRKTLGELTIGIAEKDRQIDRLTSSPCDAPEAPPYPRPTAPLTQ